MGLGHEKLDVYRLSIGYVAWVWRRVPQPIEQNRSHSIPISISIPKMRSPNKRLQATAYSPRLDVMAWLEKDAEQ